VRDINFRPRCLACWHRRQPEARLGQGLAATGSVVFAKACALSLEGIVSKREGGLYRSGRSRYWLKTKNTEFRQDVTAMPRAGALAFCGASGGSAPAFDCPSPTIGSD
jgi:hypothetical protein